MDSCLACDVRIIARTWHIIMFCVSHENLDRLKSGVVLLKLCDHLEKCAIEEEGILRVPGSVSRIKVCLPFDRPPH